MPHTSAIYIAYNLVRAGPDGAREGAGGRSYPRSGGGGFESTVRLAKSSPEMWTPIFMQNKYNILDVLRELIHQLQVLRRMIEKDDTESLKTVMRKANGIKRVIK